MWLPFVVMTVGGAELAQTRGHSCLILLFCAVVVLVRQALPTLRLFVLQKLQVCVFSFRIHVQCLEKRVPLRSGPWAET